MSNYSAYLDQLTQKALGVKRGVTIATQTESEFLEPRVDKDNEVRNETRLPKPKPLINVSSLDVE